MVRQCCHRHATVHSHRYVEGLRPWLDNAVLPGKAYQVLMAQGSVLPPIHISTSLHGKQGCPLFVSHVADLHSVCMSVVVREASHHHVELVLVP